MNINEILNIKDLLTPKVFFAASASGAIGDIVGSVYGVSNKIMVYILISIIIFDWLSAIAAAIKDKTYSSEYGINGLFRTVIIIALPAFGHLLDIAFSTGSIMFFTFAGGIAFHTWQSFTANAARAGFEKWIPNWILNLVASEIQAKMMRSDIRYEKKNINRDSGQNGN